MMGEYTHSRRMRPSRTLTKALQVLESAKFYQFTKFRKYFMLTPAEFSISAQMEKQITLLFYSRGM